MYDSFDNTYQVSVIPTVHSYYEKNDDKFEFNLVLTLFTGYYWNRLPVQNDVSGRPNSKFVTIL